MTRVALLAVLLVPLTGCKLVIDLDDDDDHGPSPDARILPNDGGSWTPDASYEPDAQYEPDAAGGGGKVTICGTLINVGDDGPWGQPGTSEVTFTAFDALAFVNDPVGAQPLPVGAVNTGNDGAVCLIDITVPALGFVAIVTDDAFSDDLYVRTAVGFPVSAGDVLNGRRLYSTLKQTDAAWTSSAGLTGGSFATRGVVLSRYVHNGVPAPGVTITASGATHPADDYYFSDASGSRTTINPAQAATGTDGSGLLLNSALVQHAGVGGLTASCSWPSSLAAAIPGVIFVRDTSAITTSTGAPCP